MTFKLEHYAFPLMAAAAVVGLWIALRPKNVQPTQANNVTATQSGLPSYTPQAVNYQVATPQLSQPTQLQLLSNPWDTNPGQPLPANPPAYLAFNFGPGHDLTKVPLTPLQLSQLAGNRNQGCSGCGGNCDSCSNDPNNSVYPDGRNATMAKSGPSLLQGLGNLDPSWLERAAYNLGGSDVSPGQLPIFNPGVQSADTMGPAAGHSVSPTSVGVNVTATVPAAPQRTLSPSSPGSVAPNIQPVNQAVQMRGGKIVSEAASLAGNAQSYAGNLISYGNQVPALSQGLLNRLVQAPLGAAYTS